MTTFFVHGYNFREGENARHQYRYWREFTPDSVKEFSWVSYPKYGPFGAWASGYKHTYDWAWDKAREAAEDLSRRIVAEGQPVDIVCHSLGSRVAYHAMYLVPSQVRRVLTLNGADSNEHARLCFNAARQINPDLEVYCCYTMHDDVLSDLGSWALPGFGPKRIVGLGGLSAPVPEGWFNVDLGDAGDAPGYGDHDWTFRNRDNHPLFRSILKGAYEAD